jgi:hypothetical protein
MDANSERNATAAEVRAARHVYLADDIELEIDDDTKAIPVEGGVYVMVGLWVTTEEVSNAERHDGKGCELA